MVSGLARPAPNPARRDLFFFGWWTLSTVLTFDSVARLAVSACCLAVVAACGGGKADGPATGSEPAARTAAAPSRPTTTISAVEVPVPDLTPRALGGAAAPNAPEVPKAVASRPTMHALTATPVAAAAVSAAAAVDLYVSTAGNDAWSGTLAAPNAGNTDGPVRTLVAAQTRARNAIAAMVQSGVRGTLRVRIQPGTYVLSGPLSFGLGDSGVSGAPVSYEAVTPGTVVISGAVPLTQQTPINGSTPVLFNNPPEGGNNWNGGGQLFVNGKRAVLARTPNAGSYWFIQRAIPLASEPADAQGRTAFGATNESLNAVAALSAADRSRAIVSIMHAWTSSQHHLASSAPAGGIQVTPSANWTFLNAGTSQRYWIENVSSAFDAPGEFFWDASGVRYIPQASEQAGISVAMPVLDKLIVINGDVTKSKWVDNLQFRGLTFAFTRALTPPEGYLDYQAATNVGAAIEVDATTNLVIDNCKFQGTGGYGVWLRRAVRASSITNSTFDDMGAGALKFGQTSQWTGDALQTGNNYATNNIIGNTGKVYPGSVGVWVGQSFDNKVTNNLIYNTPYTGISVGWSWGFDVTTSGRNTIADNLLVNIGQGQLSDMAAIYTVGVAPGTVIMGNVIREVRSYPAYGAGSWGLYGDSGTSQITFANNLVLGVDHGGFQATLSRNNGVSYNLFGWGDFTEINVGQPDPQTALAFNNNVLIPKAVKAFSGVATAPYVLYGGNDVSSTFAGAPIDMTMCGSGCTGSTSTVNATTDPRGIALVSTNTAMVTRVANIAAKVGPTTLANASSIVTVPTQKPPVVVAPPITFQLDIANAAIGTQPLGFWYSAPGNIPVTGVVANASAPNGRCLQYTDSASNVNGYDPHSYAPMSHGSGTTTGEFDLFIDSNTYFAHQWRDNASPAKTGPSLEVKASGVYVNGVVVAASTVGKWMKFKVTAPLGGSGSTWSLQVTDGNGVVTSRSGFPFVSADFKSLNWWGFISNARVTTSYCLASVKATNVQ